MIGIIAQKDAKTSARRLQGIQTIYPECQGERSGMGVETAQCWSGAGTCVQ